MNLTTPTDPPPADPLPPTPQVQHASRRRPPFRAFVQVLRRLHLYAGLMMLPWVFLYGVTAFLFNHPTAFSDQPTVAFGADALADTPMAAPPAPAELAAQVVAALQARAKPEGKYALVEPETARFTREFAFATVKADGQEHNVLIDATGSGGTVRSRAVRAQTPRPAEERAPFAVGNPGGGAGGRGGRGGPGAGRGGPGGGEGGPGRMAMGDRGGDRGERGSRGGDSLKIDNPLHERVAAAVPKVLERTGFAAGEVTVTSVPDLSFQMTVDGKPWAVTYNAQAGSVAGKAADAASTEGGGELSARRFLTRLHTTHGYPNELNARFAWALVVDAMAGIMVFWGLSGVLMWWQIKSTRWLGALVLVVSAAAAAWIGFGMHETLSAAPVGR